MFYKCFYLKMLCLIQLSSSSLFWNLQAISEQNLFFSENARLFWRYRSAQIKKYTNCIILLWF